MELFDIEAGPVHTKINENGRIVVPAELRQLMGIKPGDAVVLTVKDGVLQVEAYVSVIRKIQDDMQARFGPDRLLSEELLADRREEVRREMAETGELLATAKHE